MRVIITGKAEKDLKRLDKATKERIKEVIDKMEVSFQGLKIKKIKTSTNEWRVKVGNWRIKFTMQKNTIRILHVLPRKDAY